MDVTVDTITRYMPFEAAGLLVTTAIVETTDNQGSQCLQCSDHGRLNDCTVYHDGTTVDCCPWCAPVIALILGQMDPEDGVLIEVNPMGFYGSHAVATELGYAEGRGYDPENVRITIVDNR